MAKVRFLYLCILFLILAGGKAAFAENSLQAIINATPAGATVHLKNEVYHEPIVVKKPIILQGEQGTVFKTCSDQPSMIISGTNVTVRSIRIDSCKQDSSKAAILVTGKGHRLEELTIHSKKIAIKLEKANHSVLKNIKIIGQRKENGVDLWESSGNSFSEFDTSSVQDGFYMENSSSNSFIGNTITDSRYGIHVMYSDQILINENVSKRNITGAMVMETNQTTVVNNRLMDNNQNVNAQGLLMYGVHHSTIRGNLISNNRVGMYIEESSGNEIRENQLIGNFIGTQLNRAESNKLESNLFIRNITEIQANQAGNNQIQHNYWDSAWKLDSDGDGQSNVPYQADPYFLKLMKDAPEYQLFFQHPGMILLQKLLKSPDRLLVTDASPLMNSGLHHPLRINGNNKAGWAVGMTMVLISLLFIYKGRKKL